jgi:hypothetical protein
MEIKLCPYDKKPCIKEECMAWSGKQDLEELKREHAEAARLQARKPYDDVITELRK